MNSDAAVTLPGGAGSLDEMFEVLTWRQLGLHEKPSYLLNINGYWDPLLKMLDHMIAQGFIHESFRAFYQVFDTVDDLVAALLADLS